MEMHCRQNWYTIYILYDNIYAHIHLKTLTLLLRSKSLIFRGNVQN